ncbi:MAG: type II toxin-antitoxin system HipA family toxin [Lachnospiraceae bacterium]|nr:type II toxin-antitoxin system HipA family toxin [Lachnospiraceae bacterium]
MTENRVLEVYYHNKMVGRLAETPEHLIAFQYDAEWQKNGFSISPLSLPLNNDVHIPEKKSLDRFGGLFGVFADTIPDSWGQLLLDRHLKSLGINKDEITTLDRLAYIGSSGMGALEYHPSKSADFDLKTSGLNFDDIARECANLLSSKPSDQLDVLYKLGGSSGGTRPKILLSDNDREWIVKFPAKEDPSISGKREYDYSLCAKSCGITMTETELIPSSVCEGYFKTERFDRKNKEKIFCASFAGLLEADFQAPSCDYETYMRLINVLTKGNKNDIDQMFKVMCFNVATHNRDDHTKNFAFLYTEDNGWRLAPAYDLTYSDTYWGEHTTSVNGKGKDISEEDLLKVGEDAGLSKKQCLERIKDIADKTKMLSDYIGKTGR